MSGGAGRSMMVTELDRKSRKWSEIIDEIVRIEKKVFPEHESLSRSLEDELKKNNSGLLYVEIEAEIVGYLMYSSPSSLSTLILELAVKENFRRQGHGEALLKAAIENFKSKRTRRISLHVDPLRIPAMHLYKKLGFQIDTLVKSYYSLERDAYRMYIDFDEE